MRGQFIVSLTDDDDKGGDYLDIYTNNVIQKRLYISTNNLYSCPIYVGDVVRLELTNLSPYIITYLDLVRRDYTTDDIQGNNGIIDTTITSDTALTTYTFTATTINSAYDFEYRMSNDNVVQYQILTENSDPIMTENNDYINQEY
jgi:hypothetical protein